MSAIPALSVSDLQIRDREPRVHDLRLGETLGFERPRDIRKLIERSDAELRRYGEVCATVAQTSTKGGRPTREFHLKEPQALLVCMFSQTEKAADVRQQLIEVFMAWRHGHLAPVDPFDVMGRRLMAVERQIALQQTMVAEPLASSVSHLPIWKNGRRPKFWSDLPVRALLTSLHRQVTIAAAVSLCEDRFGAARTPSKTSIGEYWMRLDRARGSAGA